MFSSLSLVVVEERHPVFPSPYSLLLSLESLLESLGSPFFAPGPGAPGYEGEKPEVDQLLVDGFQTMFPAETPDTI